MKAECNSGFPSLFKGRCPAGTEGLEGTGKNTPEITSLKRRGVNNPDSRLFRNSSALNLWARKTYLANRLAGFGTTSAFIRFPIKISCRLPQLELFQDGREDY